MRPREAAFAGAGLALGLLLGGALAWTARRPDTPAGPAEASSPSPADGRTARPGASDVPAPGKRARRPGEGPPSDGPERRPGRPGREPSSAGPPPPESAGTTSRSPEQADAAPAPRDDDAPARILPLADIVALSETDGGGEAARHAFLAWDAAARWDLLRRLAEGRADELVAAPLAVEAAVWSLDDEFDPAEDAAAAAAMVRAAQFLALREDEYLRLVALDAAAMSGPPGLDVAVPLAAQDPSPRVRRYALDQFRRWEDVLTDAARSAILANVDADDGKLRWAAVENLPLAGPRGGETALRLLRDGGLPGDLLRPVAAAVVVADAVPEALSVSRDPDLATALAEEVAARLADGRAGRRWDPALWEVVVAGDALDWLVSEVDETSGAPALARIFADGRGRTAARVRAFDRWVGRDERAAEAVTAGLRVLRDTAAPGALRQELPWRLLDATAPPDEDDGPQPAGALRAEVLRAVRDVAARDPNRWVRDAARRALEDAGDD